jgi:hypothetical protein
LISEWKSREVQENIIRSKLLSILLGKWSKGQLFQKLGRKAVNAVTNTAVPFDW